MKVQELQHDDMFRFENTDAVKVQCRYAPHPEQVAVGVWVLAVERLGKILRYAARPKDSHALQWNNLTLPVHEDTNVARIECPN